MVHFGCISFSFSFFKKPNEHHYVDDPTEKGPNHEQKRWEEEHLHAAMMRFGAKDAKEKNKDKVSWWRIDF